MSAPDASLPALPQRTAPGRAVRSYPALRAIAALVLREMATRYGRKPGGYAWAFIQPLGMIVMLGFAFSLLARNPALGTSFFFFKASGFLIFQLFRNVSQQLGSALSYSRGLLAYPGVTWMDAVLARFLLNALVSIIVMIVLLTGDILIERLWLVIRWSYLLQSTFLALLLGAGIGMMNCFLSERFDIWGTVWGILTAPLMLTSGVIILYEDLPRFAQDILWYNPLIHVSGLMRQGFYSTYNPQYISTNFVIGCSLVTLVLGLILLRRYHRELLTR